MAPAYSLNTVLSLHTWLHQCCHLGLSSATACNQVTPKILRTRRQALPLLFPRKLHTAILQAPSSRCILAEHRSSMRKMQRIGREALRAFSFLYAALFNQVNCMLTRSLLSDWPLCIYGGPIYFLELSESTARPQCHYPIPPFPNIPTASWIPKFYHNYAQSIRQCQFLQTARFCRVRECCLDCQPRAESDVRTHGYPFTTMGSPISSTYSTESPTPRPRTHQRVLCARRGQVPRLDVRRSAACPPPHFHPPILFRTRRICIPR